MWRWVMGTLLAAAALPACDGCSRGGGAVGADAGTSGRLTPEQSRQVLAQVGARAITLGDFAAALERMDPFERMRYQTKDRRQALLDEMINVELLAREAERRGLDRLPETIELVRQFQRDELLARLRASLPRPADLPAAEVSRYYQEHRAEFVEPEQRRGATIVLDDRETARRVAREAAGASPDRWRELVQTYAPASAPEAGDKTAPRPAIEVPGDIGFISREPDPSETGSGAGGAGRARPAARASEPASSGEVPAAVREALFQIESDSAVFPEPVHAEGRHHVVRRVSARAARQRSLAEVDALIRLRLFEQREAEARRSLLEQLRQQTSVRVDEAALERVEPAPVTAPAAP